VAPGLICSFMSDYLFAYGTLRPGFAPQEMAPTVAKLRVVREGFVSGNLYDLGTCPGAMLDPTSAKKIFGIVLELPDDPDVLRRLDEYEEFDPALPQQSPFIRVPCAVEIPPGGTLQCWIYVYNRNARRNSTGTSAQ
jgi:gamma-glutamylcyclotransferase (GGCT)/AIG2-like uncharacterized protein YtfP